MCFSVRKEKFVSHPHYNSTSSRLANEQAHGRWIAEHGEEIWNWSSPAGKLRWQRRVALFADFLGDGVKNVLEIGCGTGLFTQELAFTGHHITAIDISPDLLARATERIHSPNVTFACENAYATSFANASFQAIVGSSCLHHLELAPALKEFYRLLLPGGSIMFTEPNMLNPQIAMQKNIPWLKRLAGDSPDETAFVRFSLAKNLAEAGFTKIAIQPFDFLHPALPASILPIAVPLLTKLESTPLIREIAGSLIITGTKA